MNLDITDWFMMGFVAALHVAATVFLFKNQTTANFAIWAGLLTVSGGVFHGVRVIDQKRPDVGV
jgi:hypothetical protein